MQCMQSRSESSHGKLNSLDMSRTVPLLHFAIHGFFSLGMHCSASAQLVAVSTSTIDSSAILLEPRPLCTTFYSYVISSTADEVAEWLRRWTANPLCSARVGSNPILVVYFF